MSDKWPAVQIRIVPREVYGIIWERYAGGGNVIECQIVDSDGEGIHGRWRVVPGVQAFGPTTGSGSS